MADTLTLSTLVEGSTKQAVLSIVDPTAALVSRLVLAPAAVDVSVDLGLTNVKALAIFGAEGITVRLTAATGDVYGCDPVFCESFGSEDHASVDIKLSNSSAVSVAVTIYAFGE